MKKILLSLIFILSAFATQLNDNNLCFKTRTLMYPKDVVFNALKQTLMLSHLNIETVTQKDGVLLAKGSQTNNENNTITFITVSVSFNSLGKNKTKVSVIASYSTSEKKSETGQIGIAGIILPIPVPFNKKYTTVGFGNINDPLWYQGFFNSLDKSIFEIVMLEKNNETQPKIPLIKPTPPVKIKDTNTTSSQGTPVYLETNSTKSK